MKYIPSISCIILTYNGIEDTRKCLQSVLKTKYANASFIVVDNGSEINEAEILKQEFKDKRLRFIRIKKNIGFSGANNMILKKINTKYVTLLNNDTVVEPFWLSRVIEVMERDNKIGVCQSKLLSIHYQDFFEYAGGSGGMLDGLGYPYARGRIMFHIEKDVGQYDDVREVFWASGAAMTIRTKVLKESGYFDVDLFSYVEEQDLCWRIKKAGYKIVVAPKSVVYHRGLGTWSKAQSRKTYLIHRNNLIVFLEHVSSKRIMYVLPIRIFYDWLSIFFYIATFRLDFVLPVILAHVSVITALPSIIKKRNDKKWKRNRETVEEELWPKSIVWEYFINGIRRFSEMEGIRSSTPTLHYGAMLSIDGLSKSKRKLRNLIALKRVLKEALVEQ